MTHDVDMAGPSALDFGGVGVGARGDRPAAAGGALVGGRLGGVGSVSPAVGAPRIVVADLAVAYEGRTAVRGVDGVFEAGALTAVVGPNGAGKSTFVKALVGALRPSAGRVTLEGVASRDIAYLAQAAAIDRSFPVSVGDFVSLGAWRRAGAFGGAGRAVAQRCEAALRAVGLEGLAGRAIGALSTGQFQRVLFARVIVQDAPVVVLDEPFTALDARSARDLLALVLRWSGDGRTIIAVLHDLDLVRARFPNTLLLARDQIAWGPTREALAPKNLARAQAAAEAWEDAAPADSVAA